MTAAQDKKRPCPDCRACQWCSDSRCELCQGWLAGQPNGGTGETINTVEQHQSCECGKECHCHGG